MMKNNELRKICKDELAGPPNRHQANISTVLGLIVALHTHEQNERIIEMLEDNVNTQD